MTSAARQPLGGWRNEAMSVPITVVGADLNGKSLRMQVRLAPDTPGPALLDLANVADAVSLGMRLVSVTNAAGLPTSNLMLQIPKASMQGLPYAGELGDPTVLAYAMQFDGVTRLYGTFAALASAIDSDGAPGDRPAGYGSTGAGGLIGGVVVAFGDAGITVSIDGASALAPLVALAQAAEQAAAAHLAQFPNYYAGGPGGNVMSNGTTDSAGARPVPAGADLTMMSGRTTSGDYGAGAQFSRDATVDAAYAANRPGWGFVDSLGAGFRRTIQADVAREKRRAKLSTALLGAVSGDCTVLIASNSFGQSDGLTNTSILYTIAHHLPRSIINGSRGGPRYHSMLNLGDLGPTYNVALTGFTLVQAGTWGNGQAGTGGQLQLADAGAIAFTGLQADGFLVGYDASNSTAGSTLKVATGGVAAGSVAIAGNGYQFLTAMLPIRSAKADTIYVGPTGGNARIVSVVPIINSAIKGPEVLFGARSGYGITDYNTGASMNEQAVFLQRRGAPYQVVLMQLMTNEMYRPGDAYPSRNLSPIDMVAAYETYRSGMANRIGASFRLGVAVAPQALETAYPVRTAGYLYQDYVRAMEDWAATHPEVALIFQDDTTCSGALYRTTDGTPGLHYGAQGSAVIAGMWARSLGVGTDFSEEC